MVIHELGGDTLALGLTAGLTGEQHRHLLDEIGIAHDFLPAGGEVRTQTILVDEAISQQSSISAQTMQAKPEHLNQLIDLVESYTEESWGLICGGSLPPGLPHDSYAHIIRTARTLGLITLLDSSGDGLRHGVSGFPHLLKVNQDELAALDAESAAAVRSGYKAGYTYLKRFLGCWASDALIITLGAHGVLALTTNGCFVAESPEVLVVNTAGAGDAVSGALMLARSRGTDWPEALALATAAAASVVINEGTGICHREQAEKLLPETVVHRLGPPLDK
jgi:1-phosphofructokinase family hexose kinase